ncbi:MAG: hypothetical protein VYE68_01350 [Acidobacteriota bacterium]|nr:hypothetical protein [Acidobacteriota bacterium]
MTGLGFGTLGNRQWAFFSAAVMSIITPLVLLVAKNQTAEART